MVQKSLFLVKNGNPIRVIRHDKIDLESHVEVTHLDALAMSLYFFSLAVYDDRYILLTGGYIVRAQDYVYLFDVNHGRWVQSPNFPPLCQKR